MNQLLSTLKFSIEAPQDITPQKARVPTIVTAFMYLFAVKGDKRIQLRQGFRLSHQYKMQSCSLVSSQSSTLQHSENTTNKRLKLKQRSVTVGKAKALMNLAAEEHMPMHWSLILRYDVTALRTTSITSWDLRLASMAILLQRRNKNQNRCDGYLAMGCSEFTRIHFPL